MLEWPQTSCLFWLTPVQDKFRNPNVYSVAMNKSLQVHFWGHVANTAGSVEKLVLTFARHQTRYTPVIACKSDRTGLDMVEDLPVHSFAESALKNRLLNKLLGLNAFTFDRLVPIIETERPDVLHVHNRQELVDRLVTRLSYRPAVVVHYHRNFAKPCIPESADLLLAVSDATRQHVIQLSGTKKRFDVLHNPLSDALLKYAPSQPKNLRPVILYGGGRVERKGFPEFIKAIRELKGDCLIKICGPGLDGFDPGQKNVEVLGLIPYTKFIQEMQDADIIAMPSRKEPFGLMALESLYLGKLLVATNDGGLAEILTSEYALLNNPEEPENLAINLQTALNMIANNSIQAHKMRCKAVEVAQHYTPDLVVRRLENIYDETLENAV